MSINEETSEVSQVTHDKENSQLYIEVQGSRAFVDYKLRNDRIYLIHAEVPVALRGQSMGKKLVNNVLEKLIEEGYDKEHRIIAKCPFVKHVVARSEKWRDIVEH